MPPDTYEGTAQSLPLPPLRVYLVEDSPAIRERVIEHIAECTNGEIIGCADTEDDAISGIRELRPDAVVLDIQLRMGNGFNVLRRLRLMPPEQRPIVIVFSNHADADFRRRAAGEGARYFLDKASEFEHLGNLLESLGPHPHARH
jgi:two-component system, OmpR family, response regulator